MIKRITVLILISLSSALYSGENIKEKRTGGVKLVFIPAGSFVMGKDAKGRDYSPGRKVQITKGFWIGKYEITQQQYRSITGINPCKGSKYGEGEDLPVYNISWYDAVEFCNKLSISNGLKPYYEIDKGGHDSDNVSIHDGLRWEVTVNKDADGFRLPTEAEWEYSCRAGTATDYYWGKSSSWNVSGKYSWHMFNAGQKRYNQGRFWWVKFHKVRGVGTRTPNRFGLHDMNGNVSEWCFDRYNKSYYSEGEKKDPSGYSGDYIYRTARGGSVLDAPEDLTSYKRWPAGPFEKIGMNGLRVVLPE